MNKTELVDAVADAADLSKLSAQRAVEAALAAIAGALAAGDAVTLAGFGSFQVKARPARTGRNPKTGEAIAIAATRSAAFKAGKGLKDALN
jgi:DNA-binding protein HU-beta